MGQTALKLTWINHIQGWMNVRESYSRALDQGTLPAMFTPFVALQRFIPVGYDCMAGRTNFGPIDGRHILHARVELGDTFG